MSDEAMVWLVIACGVWVALLVATLISCLIDDL